MVVCGQDGGDNSNLSPSPSKMNDVATATPLVRPALKCYVTTPNLVESIFSSFPSFFSVTIFLVLAVKPLPGPISGATAL